MRPEDYPNAYQLWQRVPGMNLRDPDDSFKEIGRLISFNPDFCYVVENTNQQIVGSILGATDGRRGTIYHLAVDPKVQRQGLGTKLVDLVIDQLKQVGIQKVYVMVMRDNQAGEKFWLQQKFVKRDDIVRFNKII